MNERKPQRWQGMTRFTRGLVLFLAGTFAFFLRGHIGGTVGKILLAAAIVLFIAGFAVASQGIARQWQEMVDDDADE